MTILTQAPEVAGPRLQAGKIDAHADFVPFADLFPCGLRAQDLRRRAGQRPDVPRFAGQRRLCEEISRDRRRLSARGDRGEPPVRRRPGEYSELIAKITGIDAEVDYLFGGPLGLQTRDLTWKPEYRQALATAIDTLRLLKRADIDVDFKFLFIDDRFIRAADEPPGWDYDHKLKDYAPSHRSVSEGCKPPALPSATSNACGAGLGEGRSACARLRLARRRVEGRTPISRSRARRSVPSMRRIAGAASNCSRRNPGLSASPGWRARCLSAEGRSAGFRGGPQGRRADL